MNVDEILHHDVANKELLARKRTIENLTSLFEKCGHPKLKTEYLFPANLLAW